MTDFKVLYAKMVDASERAIELISRGQCDEAAQTLIDAERTCEELYIESAEQDS